MTSQMEFLEARIQALDLAVRSLKQDKEFALSALARHIATRSYLDADMEACRDIAKIYLNAEVRLHESELIKYNWNYESVSVQNDEH